MVNYLEGFGCKYVVELEKLHGSKPLEYIIDWCTSNNLVVINCNRSHRIKLESLRCFSLLQLGSFYLQL